MAAVARPWYGLVNGIVDKHAESGVPPKTQLDDGDSGPTPLTTTAHELILGLYAAQIATEFNGAFVAPMVIYGDIGTGVPGLPDMVKAGAQIVHATGNYSSDYFGHTAADWASICVTLTGA
jgi:hypothetical protein